MYIFIMYANKEANSVCVYVLFDKVRKTFSLPLFPELENVLLWGGKSK